VQLLFHSFHSHFSKIKETTKHLTQTNIMKINTKKCTPIKGTPDSVMVHPNKYIDNGATVLPLAAAADESTDEISCGRECKHLPTIIYTPVMTSKRLDSYHRLLSHDDIDELNQKLGNLFVNEHGSNEEKSQQSKDEHKKYPAVSKKDEASTSGKATVVEPSSLLGRFQKVVFSYKSNTASKVSRSERLVGYGN
jgi:hypothetical protein